MEFERAKTYQVSESHNVYRLDVVLSRLGLLELSLVAGDSHLRIWCSSLVDIIETIRRRRIGHVGVAEPWIAKGR